MSMMLLSRSLGGPVVVVHVHEDSDRLSEHDAGPHDDIPQLTLEEWESREYAQWDLR